VTDVYVDVEAASIDAAAELSTDPESVRAIRYLREAGLRVILVTGGGSPPPDLREAADEDVSRVPARPRDASWYLTTEVGRCQGATARLRTVLIGAAPPFGSVRRCDAVARDLQAAAMEILAADAMLPGAT